MHKPVAWSYSSLSAFETCPHRWFLTKVSKQVHEPQTTATLWGNQVHKALELRVGKGQPLPDTMKQFEPVAQSIAAKRDSGAKIECEQKMALNARFQPTTWFGKDVWVRGITDVTLTKGTTAIVLDYKTGKPTPDSAQLRLTAAMTFAHKPYIQKVVNAFLWLKIKDEPPTTEVITREEIPDIWQEFAPRVQRLEIAVAENKFPKKPSGLCRAWCPCTMCEHNGGYRG